MKSKPNANEEDLDIDRTEINFELFDPKERTGLKLTNKETYLIEFIKEIIKHVIGVCESDVEITRFT